MRHRIIIEAHSPLTFPERKPGEQFERSLSYIPGAVLWGALGAYLQETPRARFSSALPIRNGDSWCRVLPSTAMSCKNNGGFRADGYDGVFDTLIDRACCEVLEPAGITYDPHCPICLKRADIWSGYYARTTDGTLHRRNVNYRILTRVAVDRRRGTAAEGQLYSPIVISEVNTFTSGDASVVETTRFLGWAWNLDDTELQALQNITAIGARTSSGLGRVRIWGEPDNEKSSLLQRLQAFNRRFAERWQLIELLKPQRSLDWEPGRWRVFSVGLQSPAILYEAGWQPTFTFSSAQLREATGLEAVLVRAQAGSQIAGGWNIRWNRPKPTALAATAGSVYLFRTTASEEAIVEALARLEEQGIGQRRAEGYGIVRCCDEFHVQAIGEAQ
ncbi:MAG: CRISPR-associated RAMP protein Csx10 [Herpetosiphonaceae bacterium]|nr:MAG: CRISPR-associated RAMP protein Csx10 [Herpetosiphonaceae bacterium]